MVEGVSGGRQQRGSSPPPNDAGCVARRISRTVFSPHSPVCACSLVSSLLLVRATMSQDSPLRQSGHYVRRALTAYSAARAAGQVGCASRMRVAREFFVRRKTAQEALQRRKHNANQRPRARVVERIGGMDDAPRSRAAPALADGDHRSNPFFLLGSSRWRTAQGGRSRFERMRTTLSSTKWS